MRASLSVALVLVSSGALAQDLAPPSTGTPPEPAAASAPAATPSQSTPATTTPSGAASTASSPSSAESPSTKLDASEKKDSGRGLEWFYLNAAAGFSYIDMASLSSSNLQVTKASSSGPTFGVGAGVRLFILTLGVQGNLDDLSSFSLWQLDAVLGIHIPLGHFEPYFGLHGGYCFVGSLDQGVSGSPSVSVTGGDAGLQLGLDYYFNHFVSLGLEGAGNLLFLHRPPAALPSGVMSSSLSSQDQKAYQQTGDSVGLGVGATLHLGFHL
jgi:hypothetical protein